MHLFDRKWEATPNHVLGVCLLYSRSRPLKNVISAVSDNQDAAHHDKADATGKLATQPGAGQSTAEQTTQQQQDSQKQIDAAVAPKAGNDSSAKAANAQPNG
eukprot:jgi/Chrzof1/483/Cz01g17130.t1